MSEHVLIERNGPVARVVLNRPERRNAVSLAMWRQLAEAFDALEPDQAVRVVVVTGAGDAAFSAGADITEFEETRSTPEKARSYRETFESACHALARLSKPTIAAVRGYCIGGGFELALSADLRIASTGASFGIPAGRMGLAIGHGFVQRMTALAGPGHAAYLLLTGRSVDAAQAYAMGLANTVVSDDDFDAYVAGLVGDIAALSSNSHRLHKGVLADLEAYGASSDVPPERLALPQWATAHADFHEGVRAFLERRKPHFGGT